MKKMPIMVALLIVLTTRGQVIIKGTVANAEDSVIVFKEPGGFTNSTRSWRDRRYKAIINKSGYFSITLPEKEINTWLMETKKGLQFFDLVGDRTLEVIADFSRKHPLTAVNENAEDFNYMEYAAAHDKRDPAWKNIMKMPADSALLLRKQRAVHQLQVLNQYKATHNISNRYYQWLCSKYRYEPYERTIVENIRDFDQVDPAMVKQIIERGFNDEFAALHTLEYNDIVSAYTRYTFSKTGKPFTPKAYFNYITRKLKNSTRDIQLTQLMAWLKKADDSIYQPLYKKYRTVVKNTNLINEVDALRRESIRPLPVTTIAAPSLKAIFDKYKGKVLYIDFWASWCVPCRGDFPEANRLKEKLAGKDIVFLYLGGYHDREQSWQKAREEIDIGGEHYFLNEQLMKQAEDAFHINSVPHYVIMDKQGNVIEKKAERPHDAYEQLSKLLTH